MTTSFENDIASSTTAMAAASAYLNDSSAATMSTGAISVLKGMLPDTKTTEPYSPMPRARARAKPVIVAGNRVGTITRRKVWKRVAPRQAAASSTSASRSTRIGCTVRTTKGRPMKVSTSTMANRE